MILIFSICIGVYILLISSFLFGFYKMKEYNNVKSENRIRFSIVIPFRNEQDNLPYLLSSLSNMNYVKEDYECLFINDNSTDNSVQILDKWQNESDLPLSILNTVRKTNSPKKDAITKAIDHAKFDWILTTDADCLVPENWLENLSSFIEWKNPKMIVGSVAYTISKSSFLNQFQSLDFLSLQASTIGSFGISKPFMCNGANLCYPKAVFQQVNGFEGNSQIASGDDIFLFEKVLKRFPKQVHYLKNRDSIVLTHPVDSWKELVNQRTRWASKSVSYKLLRAKLFGLIVLLGNLSLLGLLVLVFSKHLNIALLLWGLKITIDALLINKCSIYLYRKNINIVYFVGSALFYPFFSTWIVVRSIFGSYKWKNREFKK